MAGMETSALWLGCMTFNIVYVKLGELGEAPRG